MIDGAELLRREFPRRGLAGGPGLLRLASS